tara:strand:+ start:48 stop:953 length:906 start_codon:yes stop_codon:yes gene_type:complete
MNILLTGASGYLGQKLIKELLLKKNINLKTLVHHSSMNVKGCQTVYGELNDLNSLKIATAGMDAVVHLAAVTHTNNQEDYFIVNTEGTENLLKACSQNGVKRFVYMSSRAAHPEGGSYSKSKLAAEEFVKKSKMSWIILRPSEIYGHGSSDAINKLIRWILNLKIIPVIGDGKYSLSPVYIYDIIPAITEAIVNEELHKITFILAGPEEIIYNTLIDRLCSQLNVKRYKIFVSPFWVDMFLRFFLLFKKDFIVRDQIPRLLCCKPSNIDLAVKYLNYKPRQLEEGLQLVLRSLNSSDLNTR